MAGRDVVGGTLRVLTDRLLVVGGLVLFAMMLHVVADVFMKYVFNDPIEGTLEIVAYYYMVAAVFLPIGVVELARESVAVDVFYRLMPRGGRAACTVLALLVSIAIYLGFAWVTWGDALRALEKREVVMGPVDVPIWPSRFVLPVGFALAGLVCLHHLAMLFLDRDARAALLEIHATSEEA